MTSYQAPSGCATAGSASTASPTAPPSSLSQPSILSLASPAASPPTTPGSKSAQRYITMSNMFLSHIRIYPIKACAGTDIREASMDGRGLRYDRRWMLVNQQGTDLHQFDH